MMYGNAREEALLGSVDAGLQAQAERVAADGAAPAELQKVKKARALCNGTTCCLAQMQATNE